MARVPTQNLIITRGDDETIIVKVTANGLPVNITGSKLFFTAKTLPDDLDTNAVMQTTNSNHTDPVNGLSFVALSHTDTAVTPGQYHYDIQWVDVNGSVKTILKGIVTVDDDVTKRTV